MGQEERGRARRRRVLRWGLLGYLAAMFGALPLAVPCWNGFLRDSVGRVLTVEAVHVVQYGGLGWVGAVYGRTMPTISWRWALAVVLAAAGVLDELVQGRLPQRVFQWSDVGLNWLGLLLGLTIGVMRHDL